MVEPLDVHVELLIGEVTLEEGLDIDNSWLDITGDVRGAPSQGGIRINRGTAAEGQRPSPGSCTFLLNNCDGRYSPRNPAGPLYDYIGRNTQLRTYVDFPAPTVRAVSTATSGSVTEFTVNKPTGTQTGDILLAFQSFSITTVPDLEDLRLPSSDGWRVARIAPQIVTDDPLGVAWWKVAQPGEPASYTFFNPAGGRAVVAILAIEGGVMDPPGIPEAQFARETVLTNLVTTPAIAPVGSSDLEVRWAAGSPVGAGLTWTPPVGFTEHADINSGNLISGTVATRALTTTNLTTPLDFTASGNVDGGHGLTVTIASRSYRFHGEVSEWPPRANCGDGNLWVPITASGPLRRLNQGSEPISSMRKFYEDLEAADPTDVWAYWPLEDGSQATAPLPGIQNGVPMTVTGKVRFAGSSSLFGSASTVVMESTSRLQGTVLLNITSQIRTSSLYAFGGNQPDNGAILIEVRASGSVAIWRIIYSTGYIFTMSGYDADGVLIGSTASLNLSTSMNVNSRFLLTASMTESGGSAIMAFNVVLIDDNYLVTSNSIGGSLASQTIGKVKQVRVGTGLTNVTVGHLAVGRTAGTANNTTPAITGHFGEQAAYRMERLLQGTGVIFIAELDPFRTAVIPSAATATGTTPMGEEPVDTIVNKIQEAVETDRGILHEDRNRLGLIYKAPDALYGQAPTAPLDYDDLAAPLDPIDDDLLISNDVTVTQAGGSAARVVETTGPLSIQIPPAGVGTYSGGATVNSASELQLPHIANWLLRLGTWDDFRFDRIGIRNLAILDCPSNPPLTRFAAAIDPGDVVSIDNLPDWLPPNLIRVLARGNDEFLDKYDWSIIINGVPAGPYDVGIFSDEGDVPEADAPMRYSSQGSVTAGGMLLSGAAGAYSSTPDHASLDITGDIDIRADATNNDWSGAAEQTLVAKYADSTGQRSFRFAVNTDGTLRLQWSTDGTATLSRSTTVVPDTPEGGRLILRVTMDVNDGSGNRVVTFYTSPSATGNIHTGPWTQLEQFTIAGTTSIFSSGAALEVGGRDSGATARFTGVIHEAALYSGIAGTLVASPDFTTHTQGTTSFVDSLGRTWTVHGTALILGSFQSGTDTTLYVTTLLGPVWTQSQGGPFDIRVSGVRLRVTAIGAPVGMTQPFTVDLVPVNGVNKSIAGATPVELWTPAAFAK